MGLLEKIESDLIAAQKERNESLVSLLRMLKSSLKNKEIEIQKPIDDSISLEVLNKEAKKRKESALAFEQGGRADLAKKEMEEYELVKKYLPEEMSEEELKKIVLETLVETGFNSPADTGKAIGAIVAKVKGQADGTLISKLVKEELSK